MYLLAELLLGVLAAAGHGEGLTIDTTSGPITGFINDTFPNVAQFLGIPFAEQPVGELRWLPPKPKAREAGINATSFSHNCPQYMTNASNIWSVDVPEFNIPPDNDGEDCLTVNVWAPKEQCSSHGSLPVFAWIYGGGFDSGGQNVPYQIPTSWIERSQKHIVVSVAYRANIFGFPNAAGLKDDEQNLGLLDQRLGVEWIRSNIANFGGDPNRITLWGHSAGSISVDFYNFAYPEDPIINGLIMGSGSALLPIDTTPNNHSNFTFVANHFGCGNVAAEAEVDCLRKVSWQEIIAFLEDRGNANTVPALAFHPHTDGRTVFANYTERALAGNFTKKPAISGTTANEGSGFGPYNQTYGPNQTVADYYTLYSFGCPAVMTARTRYAANATTFDYLYDGNFSNISPQWWEGAFHASELPLIFGTSGDYRGASTPAELALSEKMQDYWLAFAEDPVNGLPALGWDAYRPGGDAVLLGYEDVASQPIAEARLAAPCDGFTPNGKPPPP